MRRTVLFFTFIFFVSIRLLSQPVAVPPSLSMDKALKIYVDCDFCDISYLKENFTLVNYVRDRKEADVQIIITRMRTGSGGREFSLRFVGRNSFAQKSDTLVFHLPSNYTDDEQRSAMLKNIQLGLVSYFLKTPFADKINISFDLDKKLMKGTDPWNYWVFRLFSRGFGQKEKSYSQLNVSSGLKVDKITPKIKIQINLSNFYTASKFRLYDGDSLTYKNDVYRQSYSFENLITWSLGDHWGVGGFMNIRNSTYSNYRLKFVIKPAVEYNVFSYKEATRKQLRLLYSVGYSYVDYIDTTLYNKLHDRLMSQELRVMFRYVDTWGSVDASVSGSNYLNNFNLYNVGISIETSIRLVKGLSLDLYGNFNLPHDQINLRREVTTTEEILTRQHEMQSNYSFWISGGISYTFGSIYNNVVNPRFE